MLHHKETDFSNSTDFEELKQDLKMIRYEMNNDMKKTRDDILGFMKHINLGINIIGEQIFNKTEEEACKKFLEYKENFLHYNNEYIKQKET